MLKRLREFLFNYMHNEKGDRRYFKLPETTIISSYIDTYTRIYPKRRPVNSTELGNGVEPGPSRVYDATFVFEYRSRLLNECLLKRRLLLERKKNSIWGKLDHIYQWLEWTKGGIHPDNYESQNRLFNFLNIPNAINDVGTYLIDALINQDDSEKYSDSELYSELEPTVLNIQTLTLFPYGKSELDGFEVWIVATDFTGIVHHYYVKRTDTPSESFKLLQLLKTVEPGNVVDLEDLSHARGEISLTSELGKVFFSREGGKRVIFNGFHIFLNTLDENIDLVELDNQLQKLNKQQNIPKFPSSYFHPFIKEQSVFI